MKTISANGYRRISKSQARKLYVAGFKIYALPCKLRPDNAYEHPVLMGSWTCNEETGKVELSSDTDFEKAVNSFEFYNCDNQRGRYTAFYVKKS